MKKIKTVIEKDAEKFDAEVNGAIAEGWRLTRRDVFPGHYFLAELERDDDANPPPTSKNCFSCRHCGKQGNEPCIYCNDKMSKWEARE